METAIGVSCNQKVPISIEGAIESSHASSVDAVIVKAVAKFAKGATVSHFLELNKSFALKVDSFLFPF